MMAMNLSLVTLSDMPLRVMNLLLLRANCPAMPRMWTPGTAAAAATGAFVTWRADAW